jgi:hypothetical protein
MEQDLNFNSPEALRKRLKIAEFDEMTAKLKEKHEQAEKIPFTFQADKKLIECLNEVIAWTKDYNSKTELSAPEEVISADYFINDAIAAYLRQANTNIMQIEMQNKMIALVEKMNKKK